MGDRRIKVLAGDIGGTKTSLAVIEVDGAQLGVLAQQRYSSSAFASLDDVVREFMAENNPACDYASFGIAGPVKDGKCETTNLPWQVDARAMSNALGLRSVWLINDLEANARGISGLAKDDLYTLSAGDADACGNASIISAGTGLGQAGLYWDGKCHRPFSSEGGHTDFAPGCEREISLLHYLQRQYDHVSWERVISGMGLVNIHAFLSEYRQVEPPAWLSAEMRDGDDAAAISRAAQAGRCPVCSEALDMFVKLYGVEAGNHALKIMATGGVYIGGGIAPRILEQLKEGEFLNGFWSKGRMEPLMRSMPVRIILNRHTALFGAALYAQSEINHL